MIELKKNIEELKEREKEGFFNYNEKLIVKCIKILYKKQKELIKDINKLNIIEINRERI